VAPITREQILERLRYAQLTIGTSRANFFTGNVPEDKMRYIVAIIIIGDGTASRTVNIEKRTEAGGYEMIFNSIPVAPADIVYLPQSYNVEDAIVVLEGGTNLSAVASAGSPKATVIYWDNEA
jgi:hypothetical protein